RSAPRPKTSWPTGIRTGPRGTTTTELRARAGLRGPRAARAAWFLGGSAPEAVALSLVPVPVPVPVPVHAVRDPLGWRGRYAAALRDAQPTGSRAREQARARARARARVLTPMRQPP